MLTPYPIFITVPGKPGIKKNGRLIFKNRKTGRHFIGKSENLVRAERTAVEECRAQFAGEETITEDVHVRFTFVCPDRRARDLSNLYQLYEDALQAAGVIKNDSQIRSHDGSRQRYDPANPCVVIKISRFDEDEDGYKKQ